MLLSASLALLVVVAAEPEAKNAPAVRSAEVRAPPSAQQPAAGLSGRWVMRQVLSGHTDVPFLGEAAADTHALLLLDLVEEGDHLVGDGRVCQLYVEARPDLVRPILPDAVRVAVQKQRFSARLVRDARGLRIVGKRQLAVVGAQLDDADKSALPRAADDDRVHDTDDDGHPGITLRLEGLFDIDVYLAQRQWSRIEGREVAPGRFEGTVFHDHEQVLFGADSILLQALPEMTPDLERSRFRLMRVGPKATCADAAARSGR